MSSERPPPVFDGEDFPYWKIRMETYLEAIDENVYTAAVVSFPEIKERINRLPRRNNMMSSTQKLVTFSSTVWAKTFLTESRP